MPIRLITLLVAVLVAFLYITYFNPDVAPLRLGQAMEISFPISVVMAASFITGAISVMLLYFQDTLLDAIRGAKTSARENKIEQSRRCYEAGAERLLIGKQKEAKKLFKKALSFDAENVPALTALGKMEREEGLSLQAIETHSKAKGIDGSSIANLLELAEDYIAAQKWSAAVSILNDTRKLAGDSVPPLQRIRDIYINIRNWGEAHNTQKQIIGLASRKMVGEEKKLEAAIIYETSVERMNSGEVESAREGFRSVVRHDNMFIPAYLKLAEAEDSLGWRQEAVNILEKGFKTTQSILILKALAELLFARGDGGKGVEELKWAKTLAPTEDVIALFLAEAYMREGDFVSARQEIESLDGRLDGLTLFYLIEGKIRHGENNTDLALESMNRAYMQEGMTMFRFTCDKCKNSAREYSARCKACGEWNCLEVVLG